MKELICTLFSLITSAQLCFDNLNNTYQRIFSINLFDFAVFLMVLVVLVFSVLVTKKLLVYLPVVHFKQAKIIIKNTGLFLIYGSLMGIIFWLFDDYIIILFLIIFINLVTPLFIIDNKIGYLPDVLTYPLLWVGVLYQINAPNGNVISAIYAVVFSYLVMLMITAFVEKNTQQSQMGRGDFKLVAACAAWLGVWQLPYFLGGAASLGLLQYWVTYWLRPKINQRGKQNHVLNSQRQIDKKTNAIPFGPAIIISATIWLYLSIIEY